MTVIATGPDTQDRLETVIELISRLASGDLGARAVPSGLDDDVDAVLVGVNMLAEDLEASYEQLEARVAERTAELSAVNRDITMLVDLGHRLQSATSRADVLRVLDSCLPSLLEPLTVRAHLFGEPGDAKADDPELTAVTGGAPVDEDSVRIPLTSGDHLLGLIVLAGSAGTPRISPDKRRIIAAAADQVAMTLTNLDLRDTLRKQAMHDPLTGLYNRRFVEGWLDREVSRAHRENISLGVVMMDLDRFKPVNDTYGHEAGDTVLVSIASAVADATRRGDVACRCGGEEFLVLMPGITREALAQRAEDLRRRIATTRTEHGGTLLPPVTVSIGAALMPEHGSTAVEVLRAADEALYAAKNGGRDQVRFPG